MANLDLLQFIGKELADKVVGQGSLSIVTSGPSGPLYNTSDQIVQREVANPYGKLCFLRYRWNIDNTEWNAPEYEERYAFTVDASIFGGPVSDPIPGIVGAVAGGVSADNILFEVINGHHGNVTYTLGDDLYTPVPHTFNIEWVLFTLE